MPAESSAAHLTGARWHELALQAWCYERFVVREGYPIPVVFSSPMDALSHFRDLWAAENNPFKFLLDLKDDNGTPLFEPHPGNVRYPLISIHRKNFSFRTQQNMSYHKNRKVNWPTISDDITAKDLGTVKTRKRVMAWNFNYQIDHFCMRPDTQAIFMELLMRRFWRSGGSPQTWLVVNYPDWGKQYVRMYMPDGNVENMTPPEPEEGNSAQYRTSFNVTIEGYVPDIHPREVPTFWDLIIGTNPLPPEDLNKVMTTDIVIEDVDVRDQDTSFVFDGRTNVPPQSR